MKTFRWLLLAALTLPAFGAHADVTLFTTSSAAGGTAYNIKLQIVLLLTILGLLPTLLLMTTSFTRIIIVFAILRQALGLQQSPPNRVLIGVALALTLLIMRPVWQDIYQNAFVPYDADQLSLQQALARAEIPLRQFMLAQTLEPNLEQMLRIAGEPTQIAAADVPFTVLLPAFVLSELTTAFQIGFKIFIPFMVIDLVVASVLMAMGMMMMSPLTISLPFKLIVFVLADGWALTVGMLTASFGVVP